MPIFSALLSVFPSLTEEIDSTLKLDISGRLYGVISVIIIFQTLCGFRVVGNQTSGVLSHILHLIIIRIF